MKDITNIHKAKYMKEISYLTEIPIKQLETYANNNPDNLMNIIERPELLNLTSRQFEKVKTLNEFLASYSMVKYHEQNKEVLLNNSTSAGKYFVSLMGNRTDYEVFISAYLKSNGEVIETDIISQGSNNSAIVDVKALLRKALDTNCTGIIIAHNHPGGGLNPSPEDMEVTNRIRDIVEPLGIKLRDHIIVSGWNFSSMAENDYLSPRNRKADIPYYESIKVSQKEKYDLFPKLNAAMIEHEYIEESNSFEEDFEIEP